MHRAPADEAERAHVTSPVAAVPRDPDGFVAWYEALRETGPGQGDRLFPWLAREASEEQMRWFLTQEVAGEAGFEDLVSLTQVKLPTTAKLELARNYWDEMGQGNPGGMHGPMLDLLVRELDLPTGEQLVWESFALGNPRIALHATLDVKHSASWNREVLRSLVAENPSAAPCIAEGAPAPEGRREFEI